MAETTPVTVISPDGQTKQATLVVRGQEPDPLNHETSLVVYPEPQTPLSAAATAELPQPATP